MILRYIKFLFRVDSSVGERNCLSLDDLVDILQRLNTHAPGEFEVWKLI